MKVYVIHENQEWTAPLFARLDELHIPYEDWHLENGQFNLSSVPPEASFTIG